MKPGDRVEVDGETYEAQVDPIGGPAGCRECAGSKTSASRLCSRLPCCHPDELAPVTLIFVRVET